jgi:hypothetical protein
MASEDPGRRYFFVHVMKTGGATFRRHIEDNFPGAVYPDPHRDGDLENANILVQRLLGLAEDRRRQITAYTGHFPYIASQLLDPTLTTLTILRHPVDRTISFLKHCQRYNPQHRGCTFEEIYEDGFTFPTLIHDHQAKIFAMTSEDRLESLHDVIPIDEHRLRIACRHLEQVDVIGFQDRHDELLATLESRFGWTFRARKPWRVATEEDAVPGSLRRRIEADNQADLAFYEFARTLSRR